MGTNGDNECSKRDPGLILAIMLLKQQCDDARFRPLIERCAGCQRPEAAGQRCAALVEHMEAIRQHLAAMQEIIHAGSRGAE